MIYSIRHGITWKNISSKYNIQPYLSKRLTPKVVHNICKDIETGELTTGELAIKYDPNSSTISDIKHKRFHKDISKNYNF